MSDDATEQLAVRPSSPLVAATRASPLATESGALIGRTLGKFTIVEAVGRGGSGEVYRAEQPQLGRSAVIKVLRPEHATSANRTERFLREAKLASRLDHPYAAHIYAFGVEPDGIFWIAMEHVRGMTLDELVARRGAMPPAVFGPLFARLCEVIHTAHELGIIHRDIKGSNVMVIERAGQLLPKLLDFGIAKGIEAEPEDGETVEEADDNPALTQHGATLGSPQYMAPEQWVSAHDVDARADIYALGILAYRCVGGGLPFGKLDRAKLAMAHLSIPPPALPATVPASISEVVMRALAKQPGARWPSALAFGDAMRAAIGGGVPEAVPIFDPAVRDVWVRGGPQPLADAVARLARATTTVEADAALRELVAITCRWLAVLALSQRDTTGRETPDPDLREHARAVSGKDDAAPWLRLARVAATSKMNVEPLEALATRLDDRERSRTAAGLASDVVAASEALNALEPLLAYQLVVGRAGSAESWTGVRRRDRERVIVWGEPLADGEVALLDATGRVSIRLSPLVQVSSPLPSSEPELFLLWRSGKGAARLVAAPWGFERDDDAAAQRLAVLTTEDSDTAHEERDDRSPYPGLAAYGLGDADRFVGREREVEALSNRLVRSPMVAVLGPSGAGKSSFIHAGLLPRLAESYEIITMRPGRHPLHALAALPPLGMTSTDPAAITERLRQLGERAPRGLVIVIDQLEELVTLCADDAERERFATVLAAAAADRSAPVRVVVTLRDDFATVIESVEGFRGHFDVFVLATPPAEALRRIVTEPARRAGVSVDPTLVSEMVSEVVGRAASLPLLSFTASQLWAKRDKAARQIHHESYVAIGGVAGALSTYADDVYASLARRDQDVVRDLFSRLVASDGTRIPAPRSELEQIPGAAGVLAHLIDARLLVVREPNRGDGAQPGSEHGPESGPALTIDNRDVVEIVHECLATRWDRLARWRSEDAADRALLGDVRVAARRWQENQRQSDLLWRGEAQMELQQLVARSSALTALEREFARAGASLARRSKVIRRALVAGVISVLGIVAIVMGYLSVQANESRTQAEQSAVAARDAAALAEDRLTTSMIAQGRRELNDGRALAALAYLGEAMRRGADTTAIRTMIGFANRGWRWVKHTDRSDLATASKTDDYLCVADPQGRLRFFDHRSQEVGALDTGLVYPQRITGIPGRAAAVGRDAIAVVDTKTFALVTTLVPETPARLAHPGPGADEITVFEEAGLIVYGLDGTPRRRHDYNTQGATEPVIDASGRYALFEHDTQLHHIDLQTMTTKLVAPAQPTSPNEQVDSTIIGYITEGGEVHLMEWDGRELATFKPRTKPLVLYFAAAGDRVGALSEHDLEVFDVKGTPLYTLQMFGKQAVVRLRGEHTWISTADGVIRHYVKDRLVASLPLHEAEIYDLSLLGDTLVSVGGTGTIMFSDANAIDVVHGPLPCGGSDEGLGTEGPTVSFLCHGKQLLYVGRREFATLDDPTLGVVVWEPTSDRIAIAARSLAVYERGGKLVASADEADDSQPSIAFQDADNLLIVWPKRGPGLWRWTLSTNQWTKLMDIPQMTFVTTVRGQPVLANEAGEVSLVEAGKVTLTAKLGDRIVIVVVSPDGKWLGAMLASGATAILDSRTLEVTRTLPPADPGSFAAGFDATGDLFMRLSRGALVISDRISGDDIIRDLDLLTGAFTALFLPDGRLEIAGVSTALVDVARDTRPVEQILADIACRVPLRVSDGRLESAKVQCPR